MTDTDERSLLWRQSPTGLGPSRYRDFTIMLRHTTPVGLPWKSDLSDAETYT